HRHSEPPLSESRGAPPPATSPPPDSTPVRPTTPEAPDGRHGGASVKESAPKTSADRKPASKESPEEKNQKDGNYLKSHPKAKSKQIAEALGYPEQSVRRMNAWKLSRPTAKRTTVDSGGVKVLPLTKPMLAARPGSDADPATIVADRDEALSVARARYL